MFVVKMRNFGLNVQIKSIRAFIRRNDYQNEHGSYKYKVKRPPAFFKKANIFFFIFFDIQPG